MKRFLLFPTISLVYYVLNLIFVLPRAEHVLAFLTLLTFVFIAFTIKFRHVDGWVEVETDPGGVKKVSFVISGDPETMLETRDDITLRIKRD